jgi:hypothetical protein
MVRLCSRDGVYIMVVYLNCGRNGFELEGAPMLFGANTHIIMLCSCAYPHNMMCHMVVQEDYMDNGLKNKK